MHILVLKTSSMGDVIHTLPALSDAAKTINNFSCDWVVEKGFAEIPSWHKNVNKVIPVAIRRWRKQLFAKKTYAEIKEFLKQLRAEQYDYIIDAQGLLKSGIIAAIAKGKSYGMDRQTIRDPWASILHSKHIHIPKQQHAITRIRQLFAQALNYPLPNSLPDYGIKKPNNNTDNRELIFIHGTSRDEKCWSESSWIELAKIAASNDYQIKLPWGNQTEQQRAIRIAEQCANVTALPKTSLTDMMQILSNATAAIAVDTGLCHLAAALELPTVAIYGPTDPKLIGSFGKNQIHVQNSDITKIDAQNVWQTVTKFWK